MKKLTKIEAMRAMEKAGLSFTANVLMNGCSKPTAKICTILKLIEMGYAVSHAPFETCAVNVSGVYVSFGRLNTEFGALLEGIQLEIKGWAVKVGAQ